MSRVAKRAEFIEIRANTSWNVAGELWIFRDGGQLAVGPATDLDAEPQVVSAALASDMIRAGKAEAVSVIELDRDSGRARSAGNDAGFGFRGS